MLKEIEKRAAKRAKEEKEDTREYQRRMEKSGRRTTQAQSEEIKKSIRKPRGDIHEIRDTVDRLVMERSGRGSKGEAYEAFKREIAKALPRKKK